MKNRITLLQKQIEALEEKLKAFDSKPMTLFQKLEQGVRYGLSKDSKV